MFSWQIRISLIFFAVFLAGCATPVSSNIKVSATQIAKYNDLSALDVVAALEKNVNEARSANMSFLAPNYFREASDILSKCQSSLGNKPRDELVNYAANGDAILEKGRSIMAIVKYRFAKELEFKAQLDALNTSQLLPREYEKVIGDLSGLINKVEREQPDNIDKNKEALLKALQDLEIKSVQESALHESEAINIDSKKKLADKQAPLTFADAQQIYQEAKNKIAAAHRDQPLIQRLGAEALFAARHAQQVNERVSLLQTQLRVPAGGGASLSGAIGAVTGVQLGVQVDGKPSAVEKLSVEKIVLLEENRLLGISTALRLKDLRDLPLEKQVEEIKRAASEFAHQPKSEFTAASVRELETSLKAANEATKQALAQLTEKDRLLEAQTAQLTEKDTQIKALTEKVTQLEDAAKPIEKPQAVKPKAAKSRKQ